MADVESKSGSDGKSDDMIYIENEGALFRGPARSLPQEVWSPARGAWKPYESEPKGIEWGNEITPDQAKAMMSETKH